MSPRVDAVDPRLSQYVRRHCDTRESDVHRRLREATEPLPLSRMQISIEQGQLLALLTRLIGAARAIEVGVFTGYSALCVAEQLPADGRLVACDVSEEWTSIGQRYWREAGMADRIDLRLGPAEETLAAMLDAGEAGSYDFAFIDADKTGYAGYYEQCLQLLRPGGAITFDNMFMGGGVLEPAGDASSAAIVELTELIFADERVQPTLIPIGDGVLLARKR